ncbi:MAG: hypothetical protein NVS9B7_05310 [Flavisolibacter sp.]
MVLKYYPFLSFLFCKNKGRLESFLCGKSLLITKTDNYLGTGFDCENVTLMILCEAFYKLFMIPQKDECGI